MEVQNHRDSTRRHRRLNAIVGDATEPSDGSENPKAPEAVSLRDS